MPRHSGREVVKILRELRPELPMIFCGGHDFDLSGSGLPTDVWTAILHKPYSAEELLEAVGGVLADSTTGTPAD